MLTNVLPAPRDIAQLFPPAEYFLPLLGFVFFLWTPEHPDGYN